MVNDDESKLSLSMSKALQHPHHDNRHDTDHRNDDDISVEILLSRPYYRVGGTPMVGTILVRQPHQLRHDKLRNRIESMQFTVIGLCRYDPRWFSASKIQSERNQSSYVRRLPTGYESQLPPYTVPFWTSDDEPIELMHVHERDFGRWDDVNPMKPIQLPSTRRMPQSSTTAAANGIREELYKTNRGTGMDERYQLAFTFRVNIPHQCPNEVGTEGRHVHRFAQPHSFHGVSCRYYYLLVVRLQTKPSSSSPTASPHIQWIQQPVSILAASLHPDTSSDHHTLPSKTMIMAHSEGLPSRLTSVELNQWEGQYSVNRFGSALYRNISRGQSMRIVDPISQSLVGILTILGTPNDLHHGSRLTLKMDFPIRGPTENDATVGQLNNMPCYQVSACLQGQEVAITSSSHTRDTGKRTTARRYVWDTAHETVDPSTTECVALDLLVQENIPCSIQTPNVELNIQCIIDMAIGTLVNGRIDYRNIHLEIPCHVRAAIRDWERPNDDEANASSSSSLPQLRDTVRKLYDSAIQLHQSRRSGTIENGAAADRIDFESSDIVTDLKLLSLQMATICDLKPTPIS